MLRLKGLTDEQYDSFLNLMLANNVLEAAAINRIKYGYGSQELALISREKAIDMGYTWLVIDLANSQYKYLIQKSKWVCETEYLFPVAFAKAHRFFDNSSKTNYSPHSQG